jgi:hypothetical protein
VQTTDEYEYGNRTGSQSAIRFGWHGGNAPLQ